MQTRVFFLSPKQKHISLDVSVKMIADLRMQIELSISEQKRRTHVPPPPSLCFAAGKEMGGGVHAKLKKAPTTCTRAGEIGVTAWVLWKNSTHIYTKRSSARVDWKVDSRAHCHVWKLISDFACGTQSRIRASSAWGNAFYCHGECSLGLHWLHVKYSHFYFNPKQYETHGKFMLRDICIIKGIYM